MRQEWLNVNGIPAIVWGLPSGQVWLYVHGKMSRKEEVASFAQTAELKGLQTLRFDLPGHGERTDTFCRCDVRNGMRDVQEMERYAFHRRKKVSLFACSLGAYFSLQACAGTIISSYAPIP